MLLLIIQLLVSQVGRGEIRAVYFAADSLGRRLVDFLDGATASVDYCFYNSSRSDVVEALIRAHDRGVRVRVITDNSRMDDEWVARLRNADIPVWSDAGFPGETYYMHNKFAVRDLADDDSLNDLLWTGSYNPNQDELNADFAIEIAHSGIARAYLDEFNQMWGSSGGLPVRDSARFHSRKQDVLTVHRFLIEDCPVYVYFAPQDRVVDSITAWLRQARQEIFFVIFSFTYQPLGTVMIERRQNGITVLGVIDKSGANDPASQYPVLKSSGIPVLIDSVPFGSKVLHEKIVVLDRSKVIAGSANWSNNANFNNDENVLFIFSSNVAKRFYPELVARYRESGGSLPPGIREGDKERPVIRFRRARSRFRSALGDVIYDSAGRRIAPGGIMTSGLYFQLAPDSGSFRLVFLH
ncbi:MAG: phospholipase D-like domain-containing protein [candidate division WOR-3 bacterium]|uniref:phospholipase D n=1 Tax=candidate division WOR-3 bacterium TaxID=2052148 RepID=A0A7C1NBN2_UNCW3|nr:phospholipase D-like domain-containing protein [candidate division WOR-3 bacterium]